MNRVIAKALNKYFPGEGDPEEEKNSPRWKLAKVEKKSHTTTTIKAGNCVQFSARAYSLEKVPMTSQSACSSVGYSSSCGHSNENVTTTYFGAGKGSAQLGSPARGVDGGKRPQIYDCKIGLISIGLFLSS